MKLSQILFITSILFAVSSALLQCGSRECGGSDACCDDARMGPTCYDPLDNVCANNGAGTLTLCGNDEGACGPVCFEQHDYFCCSGNLMQKGQYCASSPSTASPTTAAPTSAPNNCPGAASSLGVNCPAGTTCCGAGTMTPSCIDNSDTSIKCCEYFLSSIQCPANATCGGILGAGASSSAQCGPAGSHFCDAGFELNSFCTADQECVFCNGNGICCPHGQTACNTTTYPATCAFPSAPTSAPTGTACPSPSDASLVCAPGQTCHQSAETSTCCDADESFCSAGAEIAGGCYKNATSVCCSMPAESMFLVCDIGFRCQFFPFQECVNDS